jgi:hypothetical protein
MSYHGMPIMGEFYPSDPLVFKGSKYSIRRVRSAAASNRTHRDRRNPAIESQNGEWPSACCRQVRRSYSPLSM